MFLLASAGLLSAGPALAKPPIEVGRVVKMDVSPPLRSIPPAMVVPGRSGLLRAVPGEDADAATSDAPPPNALIPSQMAPDPARQASTAPSLASPSMLTNWEGISNGENSFIVSPLVPDAEGDVGLSDYVQWVNLQFKIWSKSGTLLYGPAAGNTLWSGLGGPCESYNWGDPQVVFDRIADRWVFMQFAFPISGLEPALPYYLCFAVSKTSDPTGRYYRYAFHVNASTDHFPDYPKLGVWPDGYYVTTNNFNGHARAGAGVFAFDRSKMLAGDPSASFIEYQESPAYNYLLPASFTGTTLPPSGAPEYFGAIKPPSCGTSCSTMFGFTFWLWRFHADFAVPSNSSFTGPTNLPVTNYNGLCSGSTECIPQPGTTEKLDPAADHLMQRLSYRRFGSRESLVAAQTVDAGGGVAGMRWYEIKVDPPGGTPAVAEQGTYAPDDGIDRWMGSVAQDAGGDIALGYSMSNGSNVHPSVGVTGSESGSGTMGLGETTMVQGGGSQTGTNRWGDYSAMSIDPSDDETFWYTQQYYSATSGRGWQTRIGSFRLVEGPSATLTQINGATATFPYTTGQGVTSIAGGCTPGEGEVSWSVSGAASDSGHAPCPSGTWTAALTAPLSASGSYTLSATQGSASSPGQTLTIDATAPQAPTLTPLPTYVRNGQSLTATNVVDGGGSGVKQVSYLYCPGSSCTPGTPIGSSPTAPGNYAVSWGGQPPDGPYRVMAQTEDNAGNRADSPILSTIVDNTAPSVALDQLNGAPATFPYATNQNVTTIGGSCGTAADDAATVSWSVSGATSASGNAPCSGGAWSAAVSLSAQGNYTLSASQGDEAGNAGASGGKALTIGNLPPVASFSFSPASPRVGQAVRFDGTAARDPDGTIDSYSWRFGDGTSGSGATASHAYTKPGTFTVQLSVADNSGGTGEATRSLVVSAASGRPPVVKLKVPRTSLGVALRRGLLVRIASNQAASAELLLLLPGSRAKNLGLGNGKPWAAIASKKARLAANRSVTLRVVPTRRARSHLRHVQALTVRLAAVVTAPSGRTSLDRRLKLRSGMRSWLLRFLGAVMRDAFR